MKSESQRRLTRTVKAKHGGIVDFVLPFTRVEIPFIALTHKLAASQMLSTHRKVVTYGIWIMTKDAHLPIWISGLYPIIRKDLFELKSVFRKSDVVGLRVPFFETSKLVTIA